MSDMDTFKAAVIIFVVSCLALMLLAQYFDGYFRDE